MSHSHLRCISEKISEKALFNIIRRFLTFVIVVSICSVSSASENDFYKQQITEIFTLCNKSGFSSDVCAQKFYGTNRSFLGIKIAAELLAEAEEEFTNFQVRALPSQGGQTMLLTIKLDAEIKINSKTINRGVFNKINDQLIEIQNSDNDPRVFFKLVKQNQQWKVAVTNLAERSFEQSSYYNLYGLMKLRRNILRYHARRAEKFEIDHGTLIEEVNDASLPILLMMRPEKKEEFKGHQKFTIQQVLNKYGNLGTTDLIEDQLWIEALESELLKVESDIKEKNSKLGNLLTQKGKLLLKIRANGGAIGFTNSQLIDLFEQALLEPNDDKAETYLQLAEVSLLEGRLVESYEHALAGMEIDLERPRFYSLIAVINARSRNVDETMKTFHQSFNMDNELVFTQPDSVLAIVSSLCLTGKSEMAVGMASKAVRDGWKLTSMGKATFNNQPEMLKAIKIAASECNQEVMAEVLADWYK